MLVYERYLARVMRCAFLSDKNSQFTGSRMGFHWSAWNFARTENIIKGRKHIGLYKIVLPFDSLWLKRHNVTFQIKVILHVKYFSKQNNFLGFKPEFFQVLIFRRISWYLHYDGDDHSLFHPQFIYMIISYIHAHLFSMCRFNTNSLLIHGMTSSHKP